MGLKDELKSYLTKEEYDVIDYYAENADWGADHGNKFNAHSQLIAAAVALDKAGYEKAGRLVRTLAKKYE